MSARTRDTARAIASPLPWLHRAAAAEREEDSNSFRRGTKRAGAEDPAASQFAYVAAGQLPLRTRASFHCTLGAPFLKPADQAPQLLPIGALHGALLAQVSKGELVPQPSAPLPSVKMTRAELPDTDEASS